MEYLKMLFEKNPFGNRIVLSSLDPLGFDMFLRIVIDNFFYLLFKYLAAIKSFSLCFYIQYKLLS